MAGSNDISILIRSILENQSQETVKSQITKLVAELEKKPITLKLDDKNLQSQFDKLETSLNKVHELMTKTFSGNQIGFDTAKFTQNTEKMTSDYQKMNDNLRNASSETKAILNNFMNSLNIGEGFKTKDLANKILDPKTFQQDADHIKQITKELEQSITTSTNASYKQLYKSLNINPESFPMYSVIKGKGINLSSDSQLAKEYSQIFKESGLSGYVNNKKGIKIDDLANQFGLTNDQALQRLRTEIEQYKNMYVLMENVQKQFGTQIKQDIDTSVEKMKSGLNNLIESLTVNNSKMQKEIAVMGETIQKEGQLLNTTNVTNANGEALRSSETYRNGNSKITYNQDKEGAVATVVEKTNLEAIEKIQIGLNAKAIEYESTLRAQGTLSEKVANELSRYRNEVKGIDSDSKAVTTSFDIWFKDITNMVAEEKRLTTEMEKQSKMKDSLTNQVNSTMSGKNGSNEQYSTKYKSDTEALIQLINQEKTMTVELENEYKKEIGLLQQKVETEKQYQQFQEKVLQAQNQETAKQEILNKELNVFKAKQSQSLGNLQYKNQDLLDEKALEQINNLKKQIASTSIENMQDKAYLTMLSSMRANIDNIISAKKQMAKIDEETYVTQLKVANGIKQQEAEQEKLNLKIKNFQEAQRIETSRITGKYTGLYNKSDIEAYYNELKKLSTINPNEAVKKFEGLRNELKRIEVNAKNSGNAIKSTMQDAISPTQALLNNMSKFGIWMGKIAPYIQ